MPESVDLEKMVGRVEWMAPVHYEILNFYDCHDIWISPRDLSHNIGYDRVYTGRECKTLLGADLLKQQGQMYGLTDRARKFLAGEIDPDELEKP